jgi:hypothetical protein
MWLLVQRWQRAAPDADTHRLAIVRGQTPAWMHAPHITCCTGNTD